MYYNAFYDMIPAPAGLALSVRQVKVATTLGSWRRRCSILLSLSVLLALPVESKANPYYPVRDLYDVALPRSSDPGNFVGMGGSVYFIASDESHGQELWRTDGTQGGTALVKDVWPGSKDSMWHPHDEVEWAATSDTLFFVANDGTYGRELWKTDGTREGTVLVKDVFPGWRGADPVQLTNVNGTVFFLADDGQTGYELWKTDGTASGTVLVKDIYPGSTGSMDYYYYPTVLTNVGGIVVFTADDGVHGEEVWRSDGTEEGTFLLADIVEGFASPFNHRDDPMMVHKVDQTVFFVIGMGGAGGELWSSDGTVEGTMRVSVLWDEGFGDLSHEYPPPMVAIAGTLFFVIEHPDSGEEVWMSDGTEEGTMLLADLSPGNEDSRPRYLANVNGTLFFATHSGTDRGTLWKSDGTEAGTVAVARLWGTGWWDSYPALLTAVDDTLFFVADDGVIGRELWKSDGTEAGTTPVVDLFPGPGDATDWHSSELANVSGTLFLAADDGGTGVELWISDGTEAGTVLVDNIAPDVGSSHPEHLTPAGGRLFFQADTESGREPWVSDGTAEGTGLVKDIRPGGNDSFSRYLIDVQGRLFFSANDGVHGEELWTSDGTETGTFMVKEIREGTYPANLSELTAFGSTLFFTANDGVHGRELWKSDGTEAGTALLKDISPPGSHYGPTSVTNIDNTLSFFTFSPSVGHQIWQSDGTESGTVCMGDVDVYSLGTLYPTVQTKGTWNFLFIGIGTDTGREVWKSDGTASGTVLVRDINPGSAGSFSSFVPRSDWETIDGTAFFIADDGVNGAELWKSDGTEEGTVMVKDINPGPADCVAPPSSEVPFLTAMNGVLYLAVNDGTHGRELWRSDGTEEGTFLVVDIEPGPMSSIPSFLVAANHCGPLLFAAYDSEHGMEMWGSDGTEEGTVRISDINVGEPGAAVTNLVVANERLFFTAVDRSTGAELWALDLSGLVVIGDTDCDAHTDLHDHAVVAACLTGPAAWVSPGCRLADLDHSSSVDLRDLALFQSSFTGP